MPVFQKNSRLVGRLRLGIGILVSTSLQIFSRAVIVRGGGVPGGTSLIPTFTPNCRMSVRTAKHFRLVPSLVIKAGPCGLRRDSLSKSDSVESTSKCQISKILRLLSRLGSDVSVELCNSFRYIDIVNCPRNCVMAAL